MLESSYSGLKLGLFTSDNSSEFNGSVLIMTRDELKSCICAGGGGKGGGGGGGMNLGGGSASGPTPLEPGPGPA